MVALALAGCFVGLIIGRRFTAFALIPVEMAALVMATIAAMMEQIGWIGAVAGFLSFWLTSQTSFAIALVVPGWRQIRSRTWA